MPPRSPLPLGDDGLLKPATFDRLAQDASYLVFAQQDDARLDVASWNTHARRFQAAGVRLTVPKQYPSVLPSFDGADVIVTRREQANLSRAVLVRPTRPGDLDDAARAEGGAGLALLARRCKTVFLVLAEGSKEDDGALLIASILSSVALGPILSPDRTRILGAKTAREGLSARGTRR